MTRSRFVFTLATIVVLVAAAAATTPARAGMRSIQEFVSAQGTYCVDDGSGGCAIFVPPVKNFIGWTVTGESTLASVDYAGLANNGPFECDGQSLGGANMFGTTTDGTVLERPLDDGRAEITVVLHTKNALSWAADGDFGSGPLLFGHRLCDVLQGADAALGNSQLQIVFVNPAPGAPLPDLMQLFVERFGDVVSLSFRSQADGTLRAAFGAVDGTHGRMQVTETGTLTRSGFHGATGDGFPAEHINLRATGN